MTLNLQTVGNPTAPPAEAGVPGRGPTIMRDETIRALQRNDLDRVIRVQIASQLAPSKPLYARPVHNLPNAA